MSTDAVDKVDPMTGMLTGYRVLDLTTELAYLGGKILGDLGADVIKVEPPGGEAGRMIGPFCGDVPDPERSLYWLAYNTSKRGLTLSLGTVRGRELLKELVSTADFLVESFSPGQLEEMGLGWEELKLINPKLIMVSVSPYGQTGPYRNYSASDLEIMATSGLLSLLGSPDRPPVRTSLPQSYLWAGMSSAMGAMVAHFRRGMDGRGQHVDVSAQASTLWATIPAPAFWDVLRQDVVRDGEFVTGRSITGAKMRAVYKCQDGYLNFIIYGGAAGRGTNRALVEWMREEGFDPGYAGEVDWESFDITTVTQDEMDRIEGPVAEFLSRQTKQEFLTQALERRMLGYPVSTAEDILADEQLDARGFWQEVEYPELEQTFRHPGGFAKFSSGFCGVRRPAPRIGEHNSDVYHGELGLSLDEIETLAENGVV